MNEQKLKFLQEDFIPLIKHLAPDAKGKWGKMDGQQMVEHVTDFFKFSTGKLQYPLVTPADLLPKYKAFLLSEKEFRENTKAPILPDEPFPHRNKVMHTAVAELETEVNDFFTSFKDDAEKTALHPVFGDLNFEEWVQLHHKHVVHHLKQFGLL
ncbi:MAG: DUF1569 domain-containing protein [Sphingobacteriales bacterium]|nr:MAG: DUF1569 domain-containing protein [Sphingobacteriales bacterium]